MKTASIHRSVTIAAAAVLLCGCHGKNDLLKSSNAQATEQWNEARAQALSSLAIDQLRDGNFEKCQQSIEKALTLSPENVNLHLLGAKLAIEQGRLEFAEAHLNEARRLDPKLAEADFLTGVLMERWQQKSRAREAYAAARVKNPREVSYLLAEAETLVTMGEPVQALILLQDGQKTFEHNAILRQEIGLLLASQGKTADAVGTLREASRLAPDDWAIRENLAFTLLSAKQYGDASETFERLSKQTAYANRPDVFAAYGECLGQQKRFYEAQKAYEQATKLDNATLGYWLGVARMALQGGDVPAADQAVRKAVSLRPGSGDAHCMLGYVRLKQHQLVQALTAFQTASQCDPADSVSVCLQGYVLNRLGRREEAQVCYAKAQSINPDTALANRLIVSLPTGD